MRYHVSTHKICHEKHEERKKNHPNAKTCKEDQDLRDNFSYKCQYCQMGQPSEAALATHITSFNDINSVSIFHNTLWTMHTPSKLALSFVHTKIVQYGQKRMDFRYMIYGLDKIPQDQQQQIGILLKHSYFAALHFRQVF